MGARARFERMLAGSGLAFAWSLVTSGASAQTAEFTLDWHAPVECPSEAELTARIGQLRGDRAETNSAALDVRAFVTLLLDGRFRAELRLVQGGSERVRVLEAPTCTELAEASAVVIALATSPAAQRGRDRAADSSASKPSESVLAAPSDGARVAARADAGATPARSSSPPRARHTAGIDASAGIATDFGATADTPALGATALGRLRYGELVSVGLRGSFFPSRASTLPGQPNEGVDVFLAAVAPLACLSPFALPLDFALCGEFELGYLHARGFGPPIHVVHATSWTAPGGGVSAAFPKNGRLRSRLSADALFPLTRTKFVLTDIGTPHRLPLVAPRIGLSLELSFP